jgi:ubiquinone/menaquinone biosynthesis methyltransferase
LKKDGFDLNIKNSDLSSPSKRTDNTEKHLAGTAPRHIIGAGFLPFGRDKSRNKLFVKNLRSNAKVTGILDIACGTGHLTTLLARKYPEASVLGIDINKDMITRSSLLNLEDNVKFMIADMSSMSFKDETYDIVTGSYALGNAPDLKKVLSEIYRVMKPGAVAGFSDFSKIPHPILQKIELFLLKLWGNVRGLILHGDPGAYGNIAESLKKLPDSSEIKKMITSLGFKNIRSMKLFFGFIELLYFEK